MRFWKHERTWGLLPAVMSLGFLPSAHAVESVERVIPRSRKSFEVHSESSAPTRSSYRGLGWARTAQRRLAESEATPQTRVTRSLSNLPAAEKVETNAKDIRIEEQSGTGFVIFLGAGGGYFDVSPSFSTGSHGRSGPSLLGQMNFLVHNERFLAELGLGWVWNQVSGAGSVTTGGSTTFSSSNITTRSGLIEFSPRVKWGIWDIGPMASVLIGTDANFSAAVGDSTPPVFVGAKSALTFETKSLLFRLAASAGISLTIPDRRVIYGMAALEMGIPVIRGKTVIRERETKVVRQQREREVIEKETTLLREVEVPLLLMTFDDQVVHFEFDRAELKPESLQFLKALGAFLAENDSDWERLKIEGHTDFVGTEAYNLKLSQARAAAVRQALLDAGVAPHRIASLGLGKSRPIDLQASDLARARNRRVELSFSGVKDAQKIRDEVNRLKIAYATPATCQNGNCR
jgi:outer membrane protein OmpA-like peptidoglycan-associated protein